MDKKEIIRVIQAMVFWLILLYLLFGIKVALYTVFVFVILGIISKTMETSEFDEDVPH